jgi:hypothetical protein
MFDMFDLCRSEIYIYIYINDVCIYIYISISERHKFSDSFKVIWTWISYINVYVQVWIYAYVTDIID